MAVTLALAAPARARTRAGGVRLAGHALNRAYRLVPAGLATCPAGVPVQTLTVVNDANVRSFALAKVENAIVAQSLQLRAAWGTPCVQFGPGGWPVYLLIGGFNSVPQHDAGPIRAYVYTIGNAYMAWSAFFSHEALEMLVDPTTTNSYMLGNANGGTLEVADPVDERGYKLDGVWVSDFVLPSYFAGAAYGVCETVLTTSGDTTQCDGPLVALANAPGPYDEMGVLTGPWQTQWEQTGS